MVHQEEYYYELELEGAESLNPICTIDFYQVVNVSRNDT